ncbi:hypothetical protein BASA_1645 [Bifidobacterium animalis subsp. animalis]|nr:hypothetical protein BASA_1645 [Bifidobacterium animalis subsp. animalis]
MQLAGREIRERDAARGDEMRRGWGELGWA